MIILSSISDPRLPQLLLDGGVGVMPTDTIYGLVTKASNKEGVDRLYSLKKRYQKLGTFMAADAGQLLEIGLKKHSLHAVEHLWPNPISIVLPTEEGWEHLDLGKKSLAVRIPKDDTLLNLLRVTGPLATSSANLFDEPPATNLDEAIAYFGDKVDFYVDAGERQGVASTILRYEDGRFETLRQGSITVTEDGVIV